MPNRRSPDICRACGVALVLDVNWTSYDQKHSVKLCREHSREKSLARMRRYQRERPEYFNQATKKSQAKLRQEVLDHYGHACACCGVTGDMFLSIDHIDNDGAEHRRQLAGKQAGGTMYVYRAIRNLGFPDGFQTLCHNCNFAKHLNGGTCPHQESNQTTEVR